MTIGQGIEIGSFHFNVIRMLVLSGMLRVLIRRERLAGDMNGLDWLMLAWAAWAMISSVFHKDPSVALVYRLGLIYDSLGIYFLLRIFCQSLDDVKNLCYFVAILLIPVAIEMIYEKAAFNNLFSFLGGVPDIPQIREGKIRAFGPFTHPILAGTVGAVCLPLVICLWRQHRKMAIVGIVACLSMIIASASSGPLMSAMAAIAALFMWRYRHRTRLARWLAIIGYILLDIIMKDPAYYVMARIDLTGGSGGWHRAALIESAFRHLHEWWLGGTDYTRHWMGSGVSWSPDHTDITNYYLHMGVIGGLPLMLLFIAILFKGFCFVGQAQRRSSELSVESRFMFWALGSALFTHTVTSISVSYFDQSFLFIYLTLAAIGCAHAAAIPSLALDQTAAL
jgi:hypothetical protein